MKKTLILIYIFLFSLTSCVASKVLTLEQIKALPHKKFESHSVNLNKKIIERIVSAPPVILNFINKLDRTDKYIPYELSISEKKLFLEYYEILPPKYKDIIEKKVIAIYFIKNFYGGGMVDYTFDINGNMYVALYLNSEILHKPLSDWLTKTANSVFADDNKISIETSSKQGYYALLHTLIHEASHIYDFYFHVTPFVDPKLAVKKLKLTSEFINGIWKDYFYPEEKYDFQYRKNTVSFFGSLKKLKKSLSFDLYKNLNKSPFSSLYGSSIWAEDFAETFTWYYLNNRLNIKYVVKISQDGKESVIFSPTDNELVKKRYKFFELLVK